MLDELKTRAADAVALARQAGATDVKASATRNRSVEFRMRDNHLEHVQENTSRQLSLHIYVGGRYSTHSTTDLRPERLKAFVDEAVALTGHLQEDSYRKLPDPTLYAGRSDVDLQLVDGAISGLDRDRRIEWLKAMNARIVGKDRVISTTAHTSDGHAIGAAVTSNGFEGTWESTWAWLGTDVTLQDEGDARPEGYLWAGGNHVGDLPDVDWIADRALADAQARLGSERGPTVKTTMVVDPRAAGRLIYALLGPANGRSLQQKQSFWADRLGQATISDKLEIIDDPLIPKGMSSRHFDSEGIAAKAMPVLKGGALQNYYIDTYYGRKLDMAPTTGSSSNRVITLGDKDLAALVAEAGSGIYVTSWLGGNNDSTTGDFSYGLRGHLIENGQITRPVGEMNVTGNLLQLFAHLVAVGNDPWQYSSMKTPTLVFEGVDFSGA